MYTHAIQKAKLSHLCTVGAIPSLMHLPELFRMADTPNNTSFFSSVTSSDGNRTRSPRNRTSKPIALNDAGFHGDGAQNWTQSTRLHPYSETLVCCLRNNFANSGCLTSCRANT
jgi:hypothetical protein